MKRPPNPPPLSGVTVPERRCSRALTWPAKPGDPVCPQEPFLHVLWTLDMDAGMVCAEHAAELTRNNWIPVQAHEIGPDCGMPGALWHLNENRCGYEDDADQSPTLKAREAIPA